MVRTSWFVMLAGAAGLAAAAAPAAVDQLAEANARAMEALAADPTLKYDPHTLLVCFDDKTTERAKQTMLSVAGARVLEDYTIVPGLSLIEVDGDADDAMDFFNGVPGVKYAEPNWFVHADLTPNDPSINQCWGLNNTGQTINGDAGTNNADINAFEAWNSFTGNPNFVIAIIDTGLNRTHPDLAGNVWTNPGEVPGNGIDDDNNGYVDDVYGWNWVSNNNNPMDDNNHGSHCAGTIGAVGNNGVGVAGVNWRCKMVGLKFLNSGGSGSISAALSALQYCTRMNIKVSNNSWGGGGYSASFSSALTASQAVGHIFCAAAGNGGYNNDTSPSYPASYSQDNVIAVAAVDNDFRLASFSQYGATSVDIGAPGVNVYSTIQGTGYAFFNGTSMATPHVTGVTALVYGQNTGWTYTQVRNRILSTARPVAALAGRCVTGGCVDAGAAIFSAPNNPPQISLSSPTEGTNVPAGTAVSLSASASDPDEGNLTGSIVWTSSLQGVIGTGGSLNVSHFIVGTHTITASITDSRGATASGQRTITIGATGDAAPATPTYPRPYRSGNGVNLLWYDNSINETGFEIQREQRINLVWTNTQTVGYAPANATSSFLVVPPGGTWRFRVRAYNGGGFSNWSIWGNFSN